MTRPHRGVRDRLSGRSLSVDHAECWLPPSFLAIGMWMAGGLRSEEVAAADLAIPGPAFRSDTCRHFTWRHQDERGLRESEHSLLRGEGFTGETNNLFFVQASTLPAPPAPTIRICMLSFEQS
jgi:hypothetical protein